VIEHHAHPSVASIRSCRWLPAHALPPFATSADGIKAPGGTVYKRETAWSSSTR